MSVICSLLATCKAHDVNPRDYLNDIIARMPYHTKTAHEKLIKLLPHQWKLQHQESVCDQTGCRVWQLIPTATYGFNKTIATATIKFIVTVAIVM